MRLKTGGLGGKIRKFAKSTGKSAVNFTTLLSRGDTLVEVTFSITIFALVAAITMEIMNRDIEAAQGNLEISMTRNEINAQAEAIRFIHNSYLSERELEVTCDDSSVTSSEGNCQTFKGLWDRLTDDSVVVSASEAPTLSVTTCDDNYHERSSTYPNGILSSALILNTRYLDPYNLGSATDTTGTILYASDYIGTSALFHESTLYGRLVYANSTSNSDDTLYEDTDDYTTIAAVEGIWVTVVKSGETYSGTGGAVSDGAGNRTSDAPEYYDFHIYACWYAPGDDLPTTIGTIIRLYNPEIVEESRS